MKTLIGFALVFVRIVLIFLYMFIVQWTLPVYLYSARSQYYTSSNFGTGIAIQLVRPEIVPKTLESMEQGADKIPGTILKNCVSNSRSAFLHWRKEHPPVLHHPILTYKEALFNSLTLAGGLVAIVNISLAIGLICIACGILTQNLFSILFGFFAPFLGSIGGYFYSLAMWIALFFQPADLSHQLVWLLGGIAAFCGGSYGNFQIFKGFKWVLHLTSLLGGSAHHH